MSLTCKFDIEKTFNTDDNTRRLVDVGGKKKSRLVLQNNPLSGRKTDAKKWQIKDVTLTLL